MSGKKRDANANFRIRIVVDALFEGNQSHFAEVVGVKRGMVSEWISGKHGIRHATLLKIAKKLDGKVSYNWIMNGYGDPAIQSRGPIPLSEHDLPLFALEPTLEQVKIEEAAKQVDAMKDRVEDADDKTATTYRKFGKLLKQVFEIGKEIGYFTD